MHPLLPCLLASCALATLATTATASPREPPAVVVTGSGRFGAFQVGRTTEQQIRQVAGKPDEVAAAESYGPDGLLGWFLTYRCGPRCTTKYTVSRRTGRLTDFETNSPRVATPNGTRVGMTVFEAQRREKRRFGPACGSWDAMRIGNLRVYRDRSRVVHFLYLHPRNSVYPDGAC